MSFDSDHDCSNPNNNTIRSASSLQSTPQSKTAQHASLRNQHPYNTDNVQQQSSKHLFPTDSECGQCHFDHLPNDMIAHIFSHLDPFSLAIAAEVCRHWRHVITDDSCWKAAFVSYFGNTPFRRLRSSSWKEEYIVRTHLIRKWEKGRGAAITFNPNVGSIDAIYVDFENSFMLAGSTEKGVAAKCNTGSGKVDKHLLFSTNDGFPLRLSTMKMDRGRILWGFDPGFITMTVRTKSMVGRQLRAFSDFHQSPVCALELPHFTQDVVLSGDESGLVKIWDVSTGNCAKSIAGAGSKITCLEATNEEKVIAGHANGTIVVWDINIVEVTSIYRARRRDEVTNIPQTEVSCTRRIIPAPSTQHGVQSIIYDKQTGVIMAAYEGLQQAYRIDASTGQCLAAFGLDHSTGMISCMEWDISKAISVPSLDYSLNSNRKKPQPRKDLAAKFTENSNASDQASGKTTRLLATGDITGIICLWDGDAVSGDEGYIKPLRILHGHASPISAIYMDACKLVSGSDDGWIRIWDPLTGTNLNTMANKLPRRAPVDPSDLTRMQVKNIVCNDYAGAATVGHQIKTWDFSPSKRLLTRHNLRPKQKTSNVPRQQTQYEINQELKASVAALDLEKVERQREAKNVDKFSLELGLTDEEMLAYAMMLSRDEHTPTSSATSGAAVPHDSETFNGQSFEDDEDLARAMAESLMLAPIDKGSAHTTSSATRATFKANGTSILKNTDDWPSMASSNSHNSGSGSGSGSSSSSSISGNLEEASSGPRPWSDPNERILIPQKASAKENSPSDMDEQDDLELQYALKLSLGEQ